jgi:hypothetical protein
MTESVHLSPLIPLPPSLPKIGERRGRNAVVPKNWTHFWDSLGGTLLRLRESEPPSELKLSRGQVSQR